jgi:hypothetical protein
MMQNLRAQNNFEPLARKSKMPLKPKMALKNEKIKFLLPNGKNWI